MENILKHCHSLGCGGHFRGNKTMTKVLQSGFYWPTLYKDAHAFVSTCDRCQWMEHVSKRYEFPLKGILKVELFDVW